MLKKNLSLFLVIPVTVGLFTFVQPKTTSKQEPITAESRTYQSPVIRKGILANQIIPYDYAEYSRSIGNGLIRVHLHYGGDRTIDINNSTLGPASGANFFTYIMQACLKTLTGWDMQADGIYGPTTKAAVKSIQARAGISQDGICGHDTWVAINSLLP